MCPEITPDFSEVSEVNNEPIPSGVYKTQVLAAEQKTSEKGQQYISWKLNIVGAEGDLAKFNNQWIFHSTMCEGKAANMLKKFYKAAMGEDLTGAFDTEQLLGKEVQVVVEQRFNDDGTVNRWPNVKSVMGLQ